MKMNKAPVSMRGIDHACVRVDDFDRAVAWYGEKLGFSIEKRWKIEQLPGVEVAYLRGRTMLALKSWEAEKAAATLPARLSWSSLPSAAGIISAS